MFSMTGQYALRAAIHLAQHPDEWPILGKDIAQEAGIPVKYLSKILSDLVREGVLEASRGRNGGFRMTRPAAEVTLKDVLSPFEAFEQKRCPFANHPCGEDSACLAHDQWVKVRAAQLQFLATTSVEDVAVKRSRRAGRAKRNGK